MKFVSIIIPVKRINGYIRESISRILKLDYDEFEIIVLPDATEGEAFPKARVITTGPVGPAEKRDIGARHAKGEILAFLDDDAYPRPDWLKNAVRHFEDNKVAAVGGPAVTPQDDTFYQKISGAVFLSRISGGNPERYWPIGDIREVDDWPSVNLFVHKEVFEGISGFNSAYWPGEDTKLCLDIIKSGKKIIYDPNVFVWHHRREGLGRHLRQVGSYGLHRGFFAKKFPETSRRFKYFLPSFFVLFLIIGVIILFINEPILNRLFYAGFGIYLLSLIIALYQIQCKEKNIKISLVSLLYIFLTHIYYGICFLQGFLFTRDLKSKLRKA